MEPRYGIGCQCLAENTPANKTLHPTAAALQFFRVQRLTRGRRAAAGELFRQAAKSTSTNGQPSRYREPRLVERLETFRSDMCGWLANKP
jgi:hypothetical protein